MAAARDVGAGAPALALARPDLHITLVELLQKARQIHADGDRNARLRCARERRAGQARS